MKTVDGFQFTWTRKYQNLIAVALSGDGQRLLTSCLETTEKSPSRHSLEYPGTTAPQRPERSPGIRFPFRRATHSTQTPDRPPVTYLVTELHEVSTGEPIGSKMRWEAPPKVREHIKLLMDYKGHTALIAYPAWGGMTVTTQIKAWSCENHAQYMLYDGIFQECIDLSISPDGRFVSIFFVYKRQSANGLPPNAIRVLQLRGRSQLDRAREYMFDLPRDQKLIGGKAAYLSTGKLGPIATITEGSEQVYLFSFMNVGTTTTYTDDLEVTTIAANYTMDGEPYFNGSVWSSPPNTATRLAYLHHSPSSTETILATTHQVVISNPESGRNLVRPLPINPGPDDSFEFKVFPEVDLCAILSRDWIWLLDASYFQLYRKIKLPGFGTRIRYTLSSYNKQCIRIISHGLDANDITCFEIPYSLAKGDNDEEFSIDLSNRILPNHKFMGAGGFGDVYKSAWNCLSLEDSQEVAIKVIRIPLSNSDEAETTIRRHAREVAVWRRVDHPNIVPFLGVISNEALSSIVTRWMPNGTVKSFLKTHPNQPCLDIIKGVADGLHFLHSRIPVIIHGDMKADNILIDETGSPRINDFGISHLLDSSTLWHTSRSSAPGSLRWMSPELMNAREPRATTASDVYAFSMTAIEIITGEVPFAKTHPREEQVMVNVCVNNDRPQRPVLEECTDSLWELLVNCWETIPSQRWEMARVCERLDSIASQIRPLRVLCIDHSYSRMSAVFVYLRTLEAHLNLNTDLGGQFDLICGSAFGGFVALLLGILGLSVDCCYAEYFALCALFREIGKRKGNNDRPFEWMNSYSKEVDDYLENLITCYGFDPKSRLIDFQFKRPRVFLIGDNCRLVFQRRSYFTGEINERPWMTLTLHAAFIHTVFLLSGYVDIIPAESALQEVRRLYGENRVIGCFISCGTGAASARGTPSRKNSFAQTRMQYIQTTKEAIDNTHTKFTKDLGDAYIRFDVKEYLESLPEEEFVGIWKPVLGANDWRILQVIGIIGKRYMQSPGGRSKLQRCLERLHPIRKKCLVQVINDTETTGEETSIEVALRLLGIDKQHS